MKTILMMEKIFNEKPDSNQTIGGNQEQDMSETELKAQELYDLLSDPEVLRAYKNARSDVYGKHKNAISKKEKQKKKAKRRMAKQSRKR